MTEIIAIIIIVIVLIILFTINIVKKEKTKVSELNDFYNQLHKLNYEIIECQKECYDLEIKNKNITFIVKLITIPEFAEIQINNQITWEIKYGAGNKIGKSQPYSKYLKNINDFMNFPVNNNQQIKVVIVSPTPKKIVKYINECEIEFVTPYTNVYGTRIISYKNLDLFKEYQIKN